MDSITVRETFLEFFRGKGHQIVPSAPMVVKNDPTLMFTNAGMNQFKDIFLGNTRPQSSRVADTQKCLRVSGKHNDLEEVGRDTYHHTMFEMLGNWSFGDYFKKEAIHWAWELLVDIYKLDPDRIYATIFEGSSQDGVTRDDEAYGYWREFLPDSHIIDGNKKDNFWEMGETGPCGPCSEIHYDLREDTRRREVSGRDLVNAGDPHVIEIWNLVFMQYNRKADSSLEELPARHVDTGMGFERLCMILQGKQSNYDTDVFQPIIGKIGEMSGRKYGHEESVDIAMRVVADHLRAIAFSIADGQLPSNVKAGYVIRRILRRAVRYGYTYLGFTQPFMFRLVEVLSEVMGGQFPELLVQKNLIENVIYEEENSFLNTLSTGINLLESLIVKAHKDRIADITGEQAFTLYDTFGFPIDLTELIAREKGLSVDLPGFEKELKAQKERSRNAAVIQAEDWVEIIPGGGSVFTGYDTLTDTSHIVKYRKVETKGKTFYQIVLDRTPFYGNSGGQVGDSGTLTSGIETTEITDTRKENNLTIHIAENLPSDPGAEFTATVDVKKRRATASNHTATHLLHEALREVLGTHVEQKGSLVAADYLRFDFSHFQKVTDEQLRTTERLVNRRIRDNFIFEEERECPIDKARNSGAMMLFGEKYGDTVRVVRFGTSVELCGGTHVNATGDIGLFKITSESAISAGIRRIEAITGRAAEKHVERLEDTFREIQSFVNNPSVLQAIRKMFEENEELRHKMDEYRQEKAVTILESLQSELKEEDGVCWFIRQVDVPADMIKNMAFNLRAKVPNLILIVGSNSEGKAVLTIMLGEDIVAKGVNASEIVRTAAREINGGGGGQPFFATAGGKNPEGMEKALMVATDLIKEKLSN